MCHANWYPVDEQLKPRKQSGWVSLWKAWLQGQVQIIERSSLLL